MDGEKIKELEELALEKGYVLDYLTCGSPIFQVKNLYTFTSDSIALAHAVEETEIESVVDLCSGSGVVGLEVAGINKVRKLFLVELQEDLAEASKCSALLFEGETEVKVINKNLTDLSQEIESGVMDVVTCNPPYFKRGSGEVSENKSRAMARHELTLTLEDIVKEASRLLKRGGKFYMIHLDSRHTEIEKTLQKFNFEICSSRLLDGKLKRRIFTSKKQ